MAVTWSAVVQLFLMALRAADRVTVPLQTAFFSFVSVPSLVQADPGTVPGFQGQHERQSGVVQAGAEAVLVAVGAVGGHRPKDQSSMTSTPPGRRAAVPGGGR
ncbi:hypothetical protein ACFY1B_48320 [Streptomyces mirabilis]|uniref:hypothetical protein n=1 Tax=Streptomyces mirabilis TaxID=68239 RepID=UPI0036AA9D77